MKKLILFLSMSLLIVQTAIAQTTTIWLVRHAEKNKSNPEDPDPDLSAEGKKRATDLSRYLKGVKLDAAFSTPLKRTHQTLGPLCQENNLSIGDYNDIKTLVATIKENNPGQTLIIAGHTNTILETIEAFGAKRPIAALEEDDFDYIFQLTLKDGEAEVHRDTYGEAHHSGPR